jgi:hypothetical protein
MTLFAHFPGRARSGVSRQDFDLVHPRYVLVPALMWTAAMAAVLVITATQVASSNFATQAPLTAEPCECYAYGA